MTQEQIKRLAYFYVVLRAKVEYIKLLFEELDAITVDLKKQFNISYETEDDCWYEIEYQFDEFLYEFKIDELEWEQTVALVKTTCEEETKNVKK